MLNYLLKRHKLWLTSFPFTLHFKWTSKGWRMVNLRLCKMAKLAFFSASLRLKFDFLNCKTENQHSETGEKIETTRRTELLKKWDSKTHEIWLNFARPVFFERPFPTPLLTYLITKLITYHSHNINKLTGSLIIILYWWSLNNVMVISCYKDLSIRNASGNQYLNFGLKGLKHQIKKVWKHPSNLIAYLE